VRTVIGRTGDPGSIKKYKCRFAALVHHILDVITINGEVTEVRDDRASINLIVPNQNGTDVEKNVTAEIEL
jgi:ribosomal protein S28E/S33